MGHMYLAVTSVNRDPWVKEFYDRQTIISLNKSYKAKCRTNGLESACKEWGLPSCEKIEALNESVVIELF